MDSDSLIPRTTIEGGMGSSKVNKTWNPTSGPIKALRD